MIGSPIPGASEKWQNGANPGQEWNVVMRGEVRGVSGGRFGGVGVLVDTIVDLA